MMQEFVQSVKDTAQEAVNNIHTCVPASVVSFDPGTGMAVVQPKAKYKKPDGETMDYPQVSGVPVVFPQSANVTIAFPVKAGDDCLLVFAETAIDYWLYGQETDTDLKFDLSSGIAIPSLKTTGNSAMEKACEEDAVVLQSGSVTLTVKSGEVVIDGNLTVNGRIEATGDVVGQGISLAGHTHTCPDGATSTPN